MRHDQSLIMYHEMIVMLIPFNCIVEQPDKFETAMTHGYDNNRILRAVFGNHRDRQRWIAIPGN